VNIGPRGRWRRLVAGAAALAAGVVILTALVVAGAGRGWRALVVVPFWLGALGVVQARSQT